MTSPSDIPEEAVEAALRAWGVSGEVPRNIARCILEAAAPHMSHVVSSEDELDDLPRMSVVLSETIAYQNYGGGDWAADGRFYHTNQIKLPAILIHEAEIT